MKNKRIMIIFIALLIIISQHASSNLSIKKVNKNMNITNNQLSETKIKILMKIGHIPSLSVCFIKNQSLVFYKGYGSLKSYKRVEPTKDIIYQVGSVTKTITSIAIMQLWEKDLFELDEDINNHLNFSVRNPKYPDVPITFRMLLAHQASFSPTDISFFDLRDEIMLHFLGLKIFDKNINYPYPWIKEFIVPGGKLYTDKVWEDYQPGEKANYSNIDFILLEHLLERISNQSYEEYCKGNIFEPFNMYNTSFSFHKHNKDQLAPPCYFTLFGVNLRFPHYDFGATGVGGLITSVEDLSHILIAHMNRGVYNGVRILNESTIKLMHTKQYPNNFDENSKCYHGLGWWIYPKEWHTMKFEGHPGMILGGGALLWMNQSKDLGIIYFINLGPLNKISAWALEKITDELYELYLESLEK